MTISSDWQPNAPSDSAILQARIAELEHQVAGLQRQCRELRMTINAVPDLVYIKDLDGRFQFGNTALLQHLDLNCDEDLIGTSDFDHLPPFQAEQSYANDQLVLHHGTSQLSHEELFVAADDMHKWIAAIRVPLYDEAGALYGLIGVFRDSTLQRQISEALLESERNYRFLAETIPQMIWKTNNIGEIDYVNQWGLDYTGLLLDQVSTGFWTALIHKDDQQHMREAWQAARLSGSEFSAIHRLRHRSGSYRWMLTRAVPVRNDDYTIVRWFGVCTDIDDQKRGEERLRASEERYRKLVEISPAMIAVHINGKIVYMNPAGATLIGASAPEELIGQPLLVFIHPDDHERVRERIRLANEQKRTLDRTEYRFIRLDKRVITVEVVGAPINYHGVPAIMSIAQDISGRKQIEAEANQRNALERCVAGISKQLLALPWTDVRQGINEGLAAIGTFAQADRSYLFLVDQQSQLITMASEWCAEGIQPQIDRLQKIPLHERAWPLQCLLVNTTFYLPQLSAIPAHETQLRAEFEHQQIKSVLQVPLGHGDKLIGILGFDAVRTERVWHELDVTLLTMAGELFVQAIERQRSGEERLSLERSLLEARQRESLGMLAGGIAHDFNNLLAVILGNAEVARAELPPNSPARATLDTLTATTYRAADLIRQLLAYAGRGRFVLEPINMNTVIAELRPLFQTSIARHIRFKIDLAPNLPEINGDAAQIRQLVLNLVINAVEASGDTEGEVQISTRIAATPAQNDDPQLSQPHIVLQVADSGCGMDEATQARIFEPFFSTKFTGRGLGLAAVQGIVQGHHGTIRVSSRSGGGSTFSVGLPIMQSPTPAAQQPNNDNTDSWPGEVALVIDDEEDVRTVTRRMLQLLGFKVLSAEDGHSALALFKEHASTVRCVLLDLTMPMLSGEETFHELRRIRPDACIVVMSGYTEDDVNKRFAGQALNGFLHKPFSPKDIRATLIRALRKAI